jgi:uncharacterized protein (DUF2237 family)
MQTNILGKPLMACSKEPLTGFYRDGSCRTSKEDFASHSVCAIMSDEFLAYSKAQGNDLLTPMPEYFFPGLKTGDSWCLCASRWKEAYDDGCAPKINPHATSNLAKEVVDINLLLEYAIEE